MGFPSVTKEEISLKLEKVGVGKGETIYVASFTPILGHSATILEDTLEALIGAVGREGTVVMPAFNWDYCTGVVFDLLETPSQVGVLTEAFRKRGDVLRSFTPPWCTFTVWGQKSEEIAGIEGSSAFGPDGITQYLYDNNARYVLIGCPYNDAVIHVHWLEERFKVPYRFWKQFKGRVRMNNTLIDNVSSMYARRLDINTKIDTKPLTDQFERTDKVRTEGLGVGQLRSFLTQDYVKFMTPFFQEDALCALTSEAREQFQSNSRPQITKI